MRREALTRHTVLVAAISMACVSACGGRVDGSSGRVEGAGDADSGPGRGGVVGAGGSQSRGGRRASGGTFPGSSGGVVTGAGGIIVIGSCNPAFCPGESGAKGCCISPNGPCGFDYGTGCGQPGQCRTDGDCPPTPVPCMQCPDGSCAPSKTSCQAGQCLTVFGSCPEVLPVCTDNFCPGFAGGKGCCLSPTGPCGVDLGVGCEPLCGTAPCSPDQTFRWRKGCVPSVCRDAGPNLPLCTALLEQAEGNLCSVLGELCTVTYGCTDVLICATAEMCPIPL
jgi:hypothetical protein